MSHDLEARKKCAEWLVYCLKIGWPKSALDKLEAIWLKYHDHRGRFIERENRERV